MLTIRLTKVGKKNKKMFRLVISEKSKDPYGNSLEILGSYNPHTKDLQAKVDRVKHWISQGAGLSDTVHNLLVEHKVIEAKKKAITKITKKRVAKMEKKSGDQKKAEADKAAKEAKEKEEAAPIVEAETPVETA